MNDMPPDPFGPPEEMLPLMRGMGQLYSAALMTNWSPDAAMEFTVGVFFRALRGVQPVPEEEAGDTGSMTE